MSYLTVQETSRGDYPEPPPLVPCRLLMTWMRESLPRRLIMVSQLYLYKGFVFIFSFFLRYSYVFLTLIGHIFTFVTMLLCHCRFK